MPLHMFVSNIVLRIQAKYRKDRIWQQLSQSVMTGFSEIFVWLKKMSFEIVDG